MEYKNFKSDFEKIESEIQKCIIGQKELVRDVLIAIIAGGNVLLEGLPGLGKTQLVKTIGRVLDLKFSRIQFTPDLMPQDVTGTNIIAKNKEGFNEFKFQEGPIFSNLVLADEINRATPKTQAALLEAMQEHTVTSGENTYKISEPFFVLATQNPIEMEGTYPLPEAQMDRFLFKLNVKFPTKEALINIINLTTFSNNDSIDKVSSGEDIITMTALAKNVPIAKPVLEYAAELILKTHPESELAPEISKKYVRYGVSPRGAQAIIGAAKIHALLDERFNVSYDDIKMAAIPALRHRIFLNFEAISDGVSADDIIESLIK